jgi:hypothetical protein
MLMTDVYATKIAKRSYTEIMKCGRFMASLKRAQRIIDDGRVHALPPGHSVPVYPIDALPGCPEDWVRGQGSYVCPVAPDWGLWFDWTMNDHLNTSILSSVKGMNPITGQKMEGLKLNQFKEKCPVHDIPFKGDERFCEKCDYRWPSQNYIASPNVLWQDGFRQPDGSVRQFFFTEDEERDVASAVIGEKNTVPAFGFAFFEPKVRREQPRASMSRGMKGGYGDSMLSFTQVAGSFGSVGTKSAGTGEWKCSVSSQSQSQHISNLSKSKMMRLCSDGSKGIYEDICDSDEVSPQSLMTFCSNAAAPGACAPAAAEELEHEEKTSGGIVLNDCAPPGSYDKYERDILRSATVQSLRGASPGENAKVAVGAGARIQQELRDDPLGIKDWKDEPSAIVRLYFVFEKKFARIMEKGVLDLKGDDSGYLKGVKVG